MPNQNYYWQTTPKVEIVDLITKYAEFRYKLCADILCWHNLGRMP